MSHTSATHCGWRYGQHTPTPKVPAGLTRSELVAAALLHDTVEKSPHFLDELSVTVPESVLNLVLRLSRVVDGTWVDSQVYWQRIASDEAAWVLKAENRIDHLLEFSQLPDTDHKWKACYLVETLVDVAGHLPPGSLARRRLNDAARYATYHWC